ncbi:hypothetical protein V1512DRAFT_261687 [Lipomyces arxii]|uniref:uncharacterized protein n=1 Tax=Lipomyces arxii TaxID=56418 RepID=UPI0034CFEC45
MATISGPRTRRPGQFPVYQYIKTCEHADSQCALSFETCCWCLDKRPHSATGKYDVYIDGRGTVNEGARWGMYCTPCKAYWAARTHESATEYTERSQVTVDRRRYNQHARNAYGTMQELSSDDYVSPVTAMFQRAVVWQQRIQEREASEQADRERRLQTGEALSVGDELQEQQQLEQILRGQVPIPVPPPVPDQQSAELEMTLDRPSRPEPMSSEDLNVNVECKVCFSQAADTVFLPCAHLAVCEWCADEIAPMPIRNRPLAHSGKLCPICRQLIKKKLKVYRV